MRVHVGCHVIWISFWVSILPSIATSKEIALVNDPCARFVNGSWYEDRLCPRLTACKEAVVGQYRCVHKGLFPLTDVWDWATIVLVMIATALAAGGGIGGGGLLVPIYMIVTNFATQQATSLSLATISGGAVANLWTYTRRYHPNPLLKRPLIDYDATLLFCPALLAGTMFGSMFSVMFPEWIVVLFLITLLGLSSYKTLLKGLIKWRAQQRINELAASSQNNLEMIQTVPCSAAVDGTQDGSTEDDDSDVAVLIGSKDDVETRKEGEDDDEEESLICLQDSEIVPEELRQIYQAEATLAPWVKLRFTALIWTIVLLFALMRGGRGGDSIVNAMAGNNVVTCGGTWYWILFSLNMLILIIFTVYLRRFLLKSYHQKIVLGHQPLEGDLHWDEKTTITYPVLCTFAGVATGLLGIGGGMVLGPLLVGLGCLPQAVSATSAYVVFITATSGLLQVMIQQLLPKWDYVVFFSFLGFVSTFLGQTVVDYLVKKYKQDSIVILLIGFIMAVALVLMTYAGIVNMVAGASIGFTGLCQ